MPSHVVAGFVTTIAASFALALAVAYAVLPGARSALRRPLALAAAAAAACALWASTAGSSLYGAMGGSKALLGTVTATHAGDGDMLAVALIVLLLAVTAALRWLAPARPRGRRAALAAQAGLLIGAALAGAALVVTLAAAVESVWSHHSAWQG